MFGQQSAAVIPPRAELKDPPIRLAGVSEGLAHSEVDVEEPLASSSGGKAHSAALAVVEDVGGLVENEVRERIGTGIEVPGRDETGGLLTEADDWLAPLAEELGIDACQ